MFLSTKLWTVPTDSCRSSAALLVPQQAGVDREAMHVLFEKLQFSVISRHTDLQTHTLTFI